MSREAVVPFSPAATWPLRGTEQLPGLCKYGNFTSCTDIYEHDPTTQSGLYTITPTLGGQNVEVLCEFDYTVPGVPKSTTWTRITRCRDYMVADVTSALVPELANKFTQVMIRYGEQHLVSLPNSRPIMNLRTRPSRPLNFGYSGHDNDDDRSSWIQAEWQASSDEARKKVGHCPWPPHRSSYPWVVFECSNVDTGLRIGRHPDFGDDQFARQSGDGEVLRRACVHSGRGAVVAVVTVKLTGGHPPLTVVD